MKRRAPPRVVPLRAGPEGVNPRNPFDGLTVAQRWAARARLLGAALTRHRGVLDTLAGTHQEEDLMDGERLIAAREAWERLGISERSFYRWVKRAGIPCYRIGRLARFKWSAIEEALVAEQAKAETRKTA